MDFYKFMRFCNTFYYFIRNLLRFFKKYSFMIIILIFILLIIINSNIFASTVSTIPGSAGDYTNTPNGYVDFALDYITVNNLPSPDDYLVFIYKGTAYVYFTLNNSTDNRYFYYEREIGSDTPHYVIRVYNTLRFRFYIDERYGSYDVQVVNYGYNNSNNNEYSNTEVFDLENLVYYTNANIVPRDDTVTPDLFPSKPLDNVGIGLVETPIITDTVETLSTGYFDYVTINSKGFYGDFWQNFYLLTFDFSTNNEDITSMYAQQEIFITKDSPYKVNDDGSSYTFMIPTNVLGLNFKNGNNYALKLATLENEAGFNYYDYFFDVKFTVSGLSEEQMNNNSLNNINGSLINPNISTDLNLPADNTSNPTISGFDSIFNTIYNALTVANSTPIHIKVPYTNQDFYISANTVYDGLDLGIFEELFSLVWYFIVSIFIVKDISKKINKIKSGNFENIQNNNVKEDLL